MERVLSNKKYIERKLSICLARCTACGISEYLSLMTVGKDPHDQYILGMSLASNEPQKRKENCQLLLSIGFL